MASLSYLLAVLFLVSLVSLSRQTLSRADRKKPVPKDSCTPGDPFCDRTADLPPTLDATVVERNLVSEQVTYADILRNHKTFSQTYARHRFVSMVTTLAFVTPWNSRGYELALTFSRKFTHVSPVWFQVSPSGEIAGRQDVKEKWLKKLHRANADLLVVPRFLFEDWSSEEFADFFSRLDRMSLLADQLTGLLAEFHLDGAVLEIWKQMPSVAFAGFMGFLRLLSGRFKQQNLYLSLVIPPTNPDPEATDETPYNSSHFLETAPLVDSVLLMSYDYPFLVQRPGPTSPLPWIEGCVMALSPNYELRHKILLGTNLYGYEFSRQGPTPLTAGPYLDRLRQLKPTLQWNEQSGEHIIQIDNPADPRMIVYPSLYSLQARISLAHRLSVGLGLWEIGQGLDYFYDLF